MGQQTAAKNYKIWYYVLLVIGIVGLFDLATRSIVLASSYKMDVGFVVLGLSFPLRFLFGVHVTATIMVYLAMIFGFAPLWLVLAYFFNRKSKVIENPSEENLKKLKRAKIVAWIVGAIIASLVLFGMGYVIYASFFHTQGTQAKADNIGSTDIATYLSGVGMIRCWQDPGNGLPRTADLEASGSLWKFGNDTVVLTNKHAVLSNADLCLFILEESSPLKLVPTYKSEIRENVDAAVMQVLSYKEAPMTDDAIQNLNYSISSMPKCPQKMQLGQSVKVIGYPAFSKIDGKSFWDDQSPRTVTEGVISAYESSIFSPNSDKVPNYFISAQIDSGSSGGVAFSIDQNKLCLLGIPTWLNVGEYDTQGIVQNIHNVLSN